MALYKLTTGTTVVRTRDGAQIPPDPRNPDYQDFLAWAAVQGNTPDPADPDPPALTLDQIYDQQLLTNRVLKGVVLSILDGTLKAGLTPAQAKAAVKANM